MTVPFGVDFGDLVAAMQVFVDAHVAPVGHARELVKARDLKPGKWAMVFVDHADHARALARHDLTPDRLPMARVFVKTTLQNRTWSALRLPMNSWRCWWTRQSTW
jgi:hypothetical protein